MDSPGSGRVSSEHEDASHTEQQPARLSALYQYHNAPEVAPAHGLEYDDTIYPVSDKFPVVREVAYSTHRYTGKHAFENDNRPPRIIFGMKVKTFLIVAAIMLLVIVGAAVGGAVGGKDLHTGTATGATYGDVSGSSQSSSSASATPTTTTSAYSAPTPTYKPLSDCPQANDTTYISTHAKSSSASSSAGLTFTLHCNLQSPLTSSNAQKITEAFVYSFSDCVEVCASYNFVNDGSNCTAAVYQPSAPRPGNCLVGAVGYVNADALGAQTGTEVAVLSLQ